MTNSHQIEKVGRLNIPYRIPNQVTLKHISRRVAAAAVQHQCYWAQSPVGLYLLPFDTAHIINSLIEYVYTIKSIYGYDLYRLIYSFV